MLAQIVHRGGGSGIAGNFPVFQRELRQWSMRITKYGHRLIEDLDGQIVVWPYGFCLVW